MIPLSVLDLATVTTGSSPAQALRDTTAMAIHAEELGYRRTTTARCDELEDWRPQLSTMS